MRVHAILVLRDEGDIVAQNIAHLLSWADAVHVLDTGSLDNTWDIVNEIARLDARVVPHWREPMVFRQGVRGLLFDRARDTFDDGDWVLRADADEFFHENPRPLLRDGVSRRDGRIFIRHADFMLSTDDIDAWEAGRESLVDRARPIEDRRRTYIVQPLPEARFFRYRRSMCWGGERWLPRMAGQVVRERPIVRHYRWRDPVQAAQRCLLRRAMHRLARREPESHWSLEDWREWAVDERTSVCHRWRPGTPLWMPEDDLCHLPRPRAKLLQSALYRAGLVRVLDPILALGARPLRPEAVPDDLQRSLRRAYRDIERAHAPAIASVVVPPAREPLAQRP